MSARLLQFPASKRPTLDKLIESARNQPPMTAEEREAQRKSWVIGEMMIENPNMTREEAEKLYNSPGIGVSP